MHSHAPAGYICPFCDWLAGNETDLKRNDDIVYQDESVTAFVAPKWWKNNPGHVIVIPNEHYENIYDIPNETLSLVYAVVKEVATALRDAYDGCTGTSTRQHNEPSGNQDVWHFHVHVHPRYDNDDLYLNHDEKRFVTPEERKHYADILRPHLESRGR